MLLSKSYGWLGDVGGYLPPLLPSAAHAYPVVSVAIASFKRSHHLKRILPAYIRTPWVKTIVVSDDYGSTDAANLRSWLARSTPGLFSPAEVRRAIPIH